MTANVSFNLAMLLKRRGYMGQCKFAYYEPDNSERQLIELDEDEDDFLVGYYTKAPTIAAVVMWMYEKHGIWICAYQYKDHAADNNDPLVFRSNATGAKEFDSPEEAYEAAIEYIIKHHTRFRLQNKSKKTL